MIEKLVGKCDQKQLALYSDVTYSQAIHWFGCCLKPMKMSIILPKNRFNETSRRPLLVWLCGGGFSIMDKDVWIPELMYFAQHGYTVASVEYRTNNDGFYPAPVVDIKAAIRYLRAHAEEYFIDPDRVVLGGESAGGCLSLLAAASDGISAFEQGDYLDQPSNVQAVLDFYGTAYLDYEHDIYPGGPEIDTGNPNIKAGDISTMLNEKFPPTFILHGDKDPFVPLADSYKLHDRLEELGVTCEMLVFEGAAHGTNEFYHTETLDRVLDFLNRVMP